MIITYENPKGKLAPNYDFGLIVKLDGKTAGHILRVEGGFAYFPKGQLRGGEVMRSVQAVKRSLEEE